MAIPSVTTIVPLPSAQSAWVNPDGTPSVEYARYEAGLRLYIQNLGTELENYAVTIAGTPSVGQVTTWASGNTIEGDSNFTWVGTTCTINGTLTGTFELATANIADDAVTYSKIQNVSASSRLLGRYSSGSGVIEEITPAEVSLMFKDLTGIYNIVAYGADPGNTAAANATAIQAALDAAKAAGGGTVYIPEGEFTTNAVSYDTSATSDQDAPRVKILGASKGASILKAGTGVTGPLLTLLGNSGAYQQGHVLLESFKLEGQNQTNEDGLLINSCVFAGFKDVYVTNFGRYGVNIFDTDQSHFIGCTFFANLAGVTINNGTPTTTGPNSLTFVDCSLSNNSQWGVDAYSLNAVTFVGGSIQYNGIAGAVGSTSYYGIKIADGGGVGYGTINFIGTIFEGNSGLADVWVDCDADFRTLNFIGCSFYRTTYGGTQTYYATNHIRFSGTEADRRLTTKGCTFFHEATFYTPSAARPVIELEGDATYVAKYHSDGSDYFMSTTEAPALPALGALPASSGWNWDENAASIAESSGSLTYNVSTGASHLFSVNAVGQLYISDGSIYPVTNDDISLGVGAFNFSDLRLGHGGTIVFRNSGNSTDEVVITHSTNDLTFTGASGASNGYRFDHNVNPTSDGGADLGTSSVRWANAYADEFHSVCGTWSPTVTSATGSITAYTTSLWYSQQGELMHIGGYVTITTVGTAGGYMQLSALPNSKTSNGQVAFHVIEGGNGNENCVGYSYNGQVYLRIFDTETFAGTPFSADGDAFYFNVTLRVS